MAIVFDLGDGLEATGHPSALVRTLAVAALAAGLRDAAQAERLVRLAPEAAGQVLGALLRGEGPAAEERLPPAAPPQRARRRETPMVSVMAMNPAARILEGPPRG